MDRIDLVTAIDENIEKVLENFSETVQYLKVRGLGRCDEMHNLLFANRRIADLVDSVFEIYHYLIRLKYLQAGTKRQKQITASSAGRKRFRMLFKKFDLNLGLE
ncbi:hypothetical protein CWI42_040780 [Ordospora colligata]|uniref:Uncharacterized protein n=1 Tax=Ordospora colligata OC4 TaxID=1354746 RepID=A0A0B2UKK2_9MICR|nr:uncharacterized protein M896_040780 [Ordospora colligata OC4]KHN69883.1 hypothetical protein M896_040780 [Ordospora colligata OC4]TBU16053.1 hypothetical protein CWI41_040780 [Ordospora colligata]TBU16266.1 hypothetical protein CWI40_040780 [Ordospora colligata]TBU18970.1 hypothetical protein CWI42_040780 [Ordospora colligata]